MDVSAINRIAQSATTTAAAVPADWPAPIRDVVQAVKALNQTEMFGQDNELEFQRDQVSKRMVIRVVNRKTDQIVSQVPPEYVLRLAEDLKKKD